MDTESDLTAMRAPESFDQMVELSRLTDDVMAFIRAKREGASERSAEALHIRLLWHILLAVDDHAAALARESNPGE